MKQTDICENQVYRGSAGSLRHVMTVSDAFSDGITRVSWYRYRCSPGEAGYQTPITSFAKWAQRPATPVELGIGAAVPSGGSVMVETDTAFQSGDAAILASLCDTVREKMDPDEFRKVQDLLGRLTWTTNKRDHTRFAMTMVKNLAH